MKINKEIIKEETLIDLKELLNKWKINCNDWYVTGEAAMIISGYPISFRDQQMDVLVCRSVWPWKKSEEEVSLFPPKESAEENDLKNFILKHGITPDFHPLPHVGLKAEDRFDQTYIYSPKTEVRILSPWAGIFHRKKIIEYYENESPLGLKVFDKNKFIRWKKFVEETQKFAIESEDKKTSNICEEVLPVIERAINFFETDVLGGDETILKGTVAHKGQIKGEVKFWDEEADLKNKIVVLKSALPHQFTKLSQAVGIITDEGGLLSHAATIAREYKIPCIIGVKLATKYLRNGDYIDLNADTGLISKLS